MRLPKTLGTCVDNLYKLNQEKAALTKKFNAEEKVIKEKIDALEAHVFETFGKQKLEGGLGKVAKVRIIEKDMPTAKDWGKVYNYIVENDAFDLLQKRLSTKAYADRAESEGGIPGIETFRKITLSVTKL